jgi:UDP-N-acetyl-D-glucosamine dehydrogenase
MLYAPRPAPEPGTERLPQSLYEYPKRRPLLPVVCVQGLGFVGAAVSIAVASARDPRGQPLYSVVGVDLSTPRGTLRIEALNRGAFPFPTTDATLVQQAGQAWAVGNLLACAEPRAFGLAQIIIVDVPFDIDLSETGEALDPAPFCSAIATIAQHMRPDALVIIETTVPPGTTARVVAPILTSELLRRGAPTDQFRLAHCYERVMPGSAYFDSIVNMPRVYAGIDERSAEACSAFLRTVVDAERSPLTRASSTTASELGKILENTYRATTIALMEEFAEFAEQVGVDLFEIVAWIRTRPTHNNIRTPGFGVGGYCLPKDPLMARLAARDLFGLDQAFPIASLAVDVNRRAPKRAVERLKELLGGALSGRRILLMGLSYRDEIGDTRHSPSQIFFNVARSEGAEVVVHDPLVDHWPEENIAVPRDMPSAEGLHAVVLAVPHRQYRDFDYQSWLSDDRPVFLDAFDVLSADQRRALRAFGCRVESIGRGAGM